MDDVLLLLIINNREKKSNLKSHLGWCLKRKEVGDDNSWGSMFEKQQTVDCQCLEQSKRHIQCPGFKKEKKWGYRKKHRPILCTGQKRTRDTHDIEWTETVHATVSKCIPKSFISGAASETSVHDVLGPQPFQDSITTDQPTAQMEVPKKTG